MSHTDAHAAYLARQRFGDLDGLRFACIAMVLWHHAIPYQETMPTILLRGFLGVDFFFVLSGFLITTILLREAARNGRFSLSDFYRRRIIRIVPVYFLTVTLAAVWFIGVEGQTDFMELLPFYYLFLSNFLATDIPLLSPTWSLAVEEQFYVLWPLLMLMLPLRALLVSAVALIGLNVATIMGAFGTDWPSIGPIVLKLHNATFAPILLGALSALLLHRSGSFVAIHRLTGGRHAALGGFAVLLILMQTLPPDLRGLPNLAIHLIMTFILVSLVVQERNILSPILRWPPVTRVGIVSYGIYLYHLFALAVLVKGSEAFGVTLNPWLMLLGYSVLSFLVADISFRTFEAWFRKFRLKPRRSVEPVGDPSS